jgi:hypothetical protein
MIKAMLHMNTPLRIFRCSTFALAWAAAFLFAGCGAEQAPAVDAPATDTPAPVTEEPGLVGQWRFLSFSDNGASDKFTSCDGRTMWHFTEEEVGTLDDGTMAMKLVAVAPDDCAHYGFEASWAMLPDGQLYISTTRMGGVGGSSQAGQFQVAEVAKHRLVLRFFQKEYTFQR